MKMTRAILTALVFLTAPTETRGAELTDAERDLFETRIRPVLIEHCYECHSSRAKQIRANLRLDGRESLRSGGESGPVVVRGSRIKAC